MKKVQNVLVLGGTGFVGHSVCQHLSARGMRVRVMTRLSERANPLLVLPTIDVMEASPHDEPSLLRAMQGQDTVINLIGVLHDRPRGEFDRCHVEFVKKVFATAQSAGIRRVIHMSALGASDVGPSLYLKSRGRGEMVAQVAMDRFDVTVFRPSVIFGERDQLTRMFDRLIGLFPFFPLAGADVRFQPVFVEDVAKAIAIAVDEPQTFGQIYELGGPEILTLRDIVAAVMRVTGRSKPILGLPGPLAYAQALVLECLPGPLMTRDNLNSMRVDNITAMPWPRYTGFKPASLEPTLSEYLANKTSRGRYDSFRAGAGRG
jgi:uncharacterized protein YbjT (DUF2867 family)